MAGGSDHEMLPAGNYSHLLLSDEENCYHFAANAFSADQNAPRMLCFGPGDHFNREKCELFFEDVSTKLAAGIACSGGGSSGQPYPATAAPITGASSVNGKKNAPPPVWNVTPAPSPAPNPQQGSSKKAKVSGNPSETPPRRHAKIQVKKERLGDRIVALQQLVSPFGKTDTASVLLEALGYIKFLQDQVQALCSPYLRLPAPPAAHLQVKEEEEEEGEGGEEVARNHDLRSRGLCLVPADLSAHVVETNGADLWTPGSSPFRMTSNR